MAKWEWAIMLVGFVGLLLVELASVRRSMRRARAEEAKPQNRAESANDPN